MAELRSSFQIDPDSEKDAVEQYHDYLRQGLSLGQGDGELSIRSDFTMDPNSPLDAVEQYQRYLTQHLAAVSGTVLPRSHKVSPIGRRIASWTRHLMFWQAW